MRDLIRLCASIFILLGALMFAVAAVAGLSAVANGGASQDATYPAMIGFIVALGGLVAGASVVLVGGTAYLLSSIDQRIESALSKGLTPPSLTAAQT